MAHRPLVLDGQDSTSGEQATTHRTGESQELTTEIPEGFRPSGGPSSHGGGYRPSPPPGRVTHRRSGERQLSGPGHRRAELPADVVPPAEHLVPDRGRGAVV